MVSRSDTVCTLPLITPKANKAEQLIDITTAKLIQKSCTVYETLAKGTLK